MDCNLIKEKLIDYIDSLLDSKETEEIEKHLQECKECKREYGELANTIKYVEDKEKNIKIPKDIKININNNSPRKAKKSMVRTGIIAITLSLIFMVTAIAAEVFEFPKWWKESSIETITAAEKLLDNGVGQKLDMSVIDKDIRITAEGVIPDDLNTIIILKIEDLKGNIRYAPNISRKNGIKYPIEIGGDIKNTFEGTGFPEHPPETNWSNLYSEEENTLRLMLYTNPMRKDEGNIEINIKGLSSFMNKDGESIVNVDGNWSLNIPARKEKIKIYEVDETIDVDGTELIIEKVRIAPTTTIIDYKYKAYNSEGKYYVDNFVLSLRHKFKTYKSSVFPVYGDSFEGKKGYCGGSASLESLYLEDPSKIKIIVEGYTYTTRGTERYTIDLINLPQTVEYQGAKITIKDILFKEDSTEVTIIEDHSKNRKYTQSIIDIKAKDNPYAITSREYRDFEIKDKKGRTVDLNNEKWEMTMYNFIKEQRIELKNSQVREYRPESKNYTKELIPEKLYIKGLEYNKFPNVKKTIKLK